MCFVRLNPWSAFLATNPSLGVFSIPSIEVSPLDFFDDIAVQYDAAKSAHDLQRVLSDRIVDAVGPDILVATPSPDVHSNREQMSSFDSPSINNQSASLESHETEHGKLATQSSISSVSPQQLQVVSCSFDSTPVSPVYQPGQQLNYGFTCNQDTNVQMYAALFFFFLYLDSGLDFPNVIVLHLC